MGAPPPGRPDAGAPPACREALAREPNTDLGLQVPTARGLFRLLGRAMRLRCPSCGRGPVLVHWFRLRTRCGACGLALERGETDYFIGGMMLNVALAEALFAVLFVGFLWLRWPEVPWDVVQVVAPLGMLLAPVVLYPVSRLAWLAFDLALRPEGSKVT